MTYTAIGSVSLKGKECKLIIGSDNQWYKAMAIGTYREDPLHHSPILIKYGEVEPLTIKEFKAIFK